jgi:hypothetical protein
MYTDFNQIIRKVAQQESRVARQHKQRLNNPRTQLATSMPGIVPATIVIPSRFVP